MASVDKLRGITVALVTPFDDNGVLAPERALTLIERHIEAGVNGFYVGGSTGEGFLASVSERSEYLKFVAEATKKRVPAPSSGGTVSTITRMAR